MKLQFRQIEPFVKKPDPDVVAVLLYGPDEGLVRERMNILTRHVVADPNDPFNIIDITGQQLADDPARLTDEAQSISMMGGRRVVRVRDAGDKNAAAIKETIAQITPRDGFILIEAGELNPRSALRLLFEQDKKSVALPCYVEDERDISRIIRDGLKENGYSISSDALTHMAAHVVGDRAIARSEIQKMIIYMGPQKNIDLDDAIACVGNSASLSIDLLAKAAAGGLYAEAERVLENLLSEGTAAVTILRAMQNYFTRLHVTKIRMAKGDSIDIAMKKLRPEVFWKNRDAFVAQTHAWDIMMLEQVMARLMAAEARTKQTGADPDLILSRVLLSITQMAARAMAPKRRAY